VASKNNTPLGYVELPNGDMAIFPMNDVFLNYTFKDMEHWEALRLAVNLIIEAYKQLKPETRLNTINGSINVKTQFRQFLSSANKNANAKFRDQDIKMTEDKVSVTYVEFQNDAFPDPPIKIRSVEYFGLGIGHNKGNIANQIWLLAEDVNDVLHGKTFTRYILKDEVTDKVHPESSGIMYVSLPKLAKENTPVGELASFLLGINTDPQNEVVKKIADIFNASFQDFKEDEDVVTVLTHEERVRGKVWNAALAEGENKNKAEMASQVIALEEKGLDPAEILKQLKSLLVAVPNANTTKK
jgi:hypothetical protein